MARPIGSYSHWWKIRKRMTVFLYDPKDKDIESIRALAAEINDRSRRRFYKGGE